MLQKLRFIDWKLLASAVCIMTIGLITVYSTTRAMNPSLFHKQIISAGIGICLMLIFSKMYYHIYFKLSSLIYALSLFLLIAVLFFGNTIRGSKSWFDLGIFSFQPAEYARLAIIIILAVYIEKKHRMIEKFSTVVGALCITAIPMGLILLQPDFGSTLVFIPIVFAMLYLAGASRIQLSLLILYGAVSLGIPLYITFMKMSDPNVVVFKHPVLIAIIFILGSVFVYFLLNRFFIKISFIWFVVITLIVGAGIGTSFVIQKVLKEYQRQRLVVFLNPSLDKHGAGYNVIQSKIAVGSGGLFGKGIFSGTQGQLGFLPERHTDFIFSVAAEEFGFFGSGILIILFLFLIWRIYIIAKYSRDLFGMLIAGGILTMLSFYSILNMGVVMGLMPVTGLPLPLVSYGGSSLVMTCIALGIVLNINAKRHVNI